VAGGVSVNETLLHISQEDLPFRRASAPSGHGAPTTGRQGFETFFPHEAHLSSIAPERPRLVQASLRRAIRGADQVVAALTMRFDAPRIFASGGNGARPVSRCCNRPTALVRVLRRPGATRKEVSSTATMRKMLAAPGAGNPGRRHARRRGCAKPPRSMKLIQAFDRTLNWIVSGPPG